MDVNFINPVLKSTLNIFSTMARIEPKVGSSRLKSKSDIPQGKNITGLMSMVGKKAMHLLRLLFQKPQFCISPIRSCHRKSHQSMEWLSISLVSWRIWFSAAQKVSLRMRVMFSDYRCQQSNWVVII